MTIDQAKLDRIKASLASDAKAEGVTPGPWVTGSIPWRVWADGGLKTICNVASADDDEIPVGSGLALSEAMARNRDFIARARTTAPAMAKMLLDEILWLELMMQTDDGSTLYRVCRNRLASIVNGWPEGTL